MVEEAGAGRWAAGEDELWLAVAAQPGWEQQAVTGQKVQVVVQGGREQVQVVAALAGEGLWLAGVGVGLEAELRVALQVGVDEGPEAGWEGAQVASLVGRQRSVQRCLPQSAVQVVRFTQHFNTFTLNNRCSWTMYDEQCSRHASELYGMVAVQHGQLQSLRAL